MAIIECRNVGKRYTTQTHRPGLLGVLRSFVDRQSSEFEALKDISLTVEPGEFIGLIGENGAGKTTLIKILTGIIPASSGEARLLGKDSFYMSDREKSRISLVMGQRSQLWWDVPAIDSFKLLREIYRVPHDRFDERIAYLSEQLEVTGQLDVQLRKLSLGQRMKMEIIGALLHEPDAVFLDEPTIGLDLVSRETIRKFLVDLNRERQVTVILTSHHMEDIERTCKRILILDRGQLLFDGDLYRLKQKTMDKRAVEVTLADDSESFGDEAMEQARELGANLVRQLPGQLSFVVPASRVQPFTRFLMDRFEIRDLAIEHEPLENLIRNIFVTKEIDLDDEPTEAGT